MKKLGVTTVVDTDGEPLRHAVRAEPDVVSPNVGEAEELVGHEFNDDDERALGIAEVVELGPREAIMTVPDGCFAHVAGETGPQLFRVRVAEQEARAAVGSGDAFLAGYVAARYDGGTPEECLRFGVACGAESTQHFGAGVIDPQAVERLLRERRGGAAGAAGRGLLSGGARGMVRRGPALLSTAVGGRRPRHQESLLRPRPRGAVPSASTHTVPQWR